MTGRLVRSAAAAAVVLSALACAKPSDESAIRALLAQSVTLAEKRDARGLMEFFAPDYVDSAGRDRAGTLRLVSEYLDRYRGLVIHLLAARVGDIGPDGRASVECEVSLSHGAATVLRRLVRYAGESYRFKFELRKAEPGEWRFTYAEWRSIGLSELFPESLEVLKKLFPGL